MVWFRSPFLSPVTDSMNHPHPRPGVLLGPVLRALLPDALQLPQVDDRPAIPDATKVLDGQKQLDGFAFFREASMVSSSDSIDLCSVRK